ncbi:MAG: DUF3137 domain-containing protein [Alphaproteobacteria bacterium]|nr:DUF3137 domain-containing protein [Alphaproteobacteria bacterium]
MEEQTTGAEGFEEYLKNEVLPLIEENNQLKDKYCGKFWTYLLTILFIVGVDVLSAFFYAQMHKTTPNYEQLILFGVVALSFVYIPIFMYRRQKKHNIFERFINYYGIWKHQENKEVKLVHSPIIPAHDGVKSAHCVEGTFEGVKTEIRDTAYLNAKNKTVSSGVVVYLTFPQNFVSTTLLFDKKGFYRKNKYAELECINDKIQVPAANYFNIFSDDAEVSVRILEDLFLERVLDMKDVFKAHNLYIEICNNIIRLYFEGSSLYFDDQKLWSNKVDLNKFKQLNSEFEQTLMFIQLVNGLWAE